MSYIDALRIDGTDYDIKDSAAIHMDEWLDIVYPVGSIYMSINSTNPNTLFGGSWQRITGKFLLSATDGGATGTNVNSRADVAPGASGGTATHSHTNPNTGTNNGNTGASTGNTGGTKLTAAQSGVPAHQHAPSSVTTRRFVLATASPSTDAASNIGGSGNKYPYITGSNTWESVSGTQPNTAQNAASAHSHSLGGHTHTLGNHSHTQGNTGSSNNMPPFLSVYVWKRVS